MAYLSLKSKHCVEVRSKRSYSGTFLLLVQKSRRHMEEANEVCHCLVRPFDFAQGDDFQKKKAARLNAQRSACAQRRMISGLTHNSKRFFWQMHKRISRGVEFVGFECG